MKVELNIMPQFDVFLSHSSVDKAWVTGLKDDLLHYGVSVWLDRDEIRPGDLFAEALEQALDNCRAVALIVSPEAINSGWVREEYYRAMSIAKTERSSVRIIPVILREAELPGFLQSRNWVDFRDETAYARNVWKLVWGITGEKPAQALDLSAADLPSVTPIQSGRRTEAMTANTIASSDLPGKSQRVAKVSIPEPPDQFSSFRIGNIEIPAMMVFGTPAIPFLPSDVKLVFRPEFIEDHPKYPMELKAVRDFLIEIAQHEDNIKELKEMDPMPRIDNIEQGPERSGDVRGELTIYLSKTRYGSLFTTHRSLDYRVIPSSDTASHHTIREVYCHPPYTDLSNSFLANCPGVDVALISRNKNQDPQNQLVIRKRSQNVVGYRGWHQVSATGYMSLEHKDHTGVPSPFVTAITEARQEIADSLVLRPEDFKLVGLALKWEDLHPGFFGYIETNKPVSELIGDFKRDAYEGYLYRISFDPASVLSHIAEEKWHAISALSAIAALLAFFPRQEVELFAKKVSPKGFKDFIEKT